MDEVLFHLSHRIEIFQIWLTEALSKVGDAIEAGLASEQVLRLQEALREAAAKAAAASALALRRAVAAAHPNILADRLSSILGPEMNRATLYAGCVGFTIGSGLGLVLGSCLQSPSQPVTLMKAIAATSFTGADSVVILEDAVVPTVTKPDQVLVQVKACCLDPVDIRISHGYARALRYHFNRYNPNWRGELPVILGRDGSGVVAEVGSGVAHLEVGDHVYFAAPPWAQGLASEWALLPGDSVTRKPNRIGFEGSASIPYSGVMAWHAVVKSAGLSTRNAHTKRVLVHSGSCGCGWMIVQLCSHLGASVTVTSPNRATSVMRSLGATEVIPLESGDAERILLRKAKFDVVFNTVGCLAQSFCLSVCSSEGSVVTAAPGILATDTFGIILGAMYSMWIRLTHCVFGPESRTDINCRKEAMEELRKLTDSGRLQPLVDKIFTMDEVDRALRHVETGTAVGKTVVRFGKSSSKDPRAGDKPDLLS